MSWADFGSGISTQSLFRPMSTARTAAWQYIGNDISSGVGAGVDTADMLRSLASFLGAAAEGYRYEMSAGAGASENASLFPAHVTEWAYQNDDEISMLSIDPREHARELGSDAGRAAGSWVVDGNTSADELRLIASDEWEADPPAPLSGEWAGDPSPRDILEQCGLSEDDDSADDVLSEYEQAFSEAWTAEAQRSALAMLPDDSAGDESAAAYTIRAIAQDVDRD